MTKKEETTSPSYPKRAWDDPGIVALLSHQYGKKEIHLSAGKRFGRPPADRCLELMEKALAMGCTMQEVACLVGVSVRTVERWQKFDPEVARIIARGRVRLKISVRRMQWQSAERGDSRMLIWLGKNILGQSDKGPIFGDPEKATSVARDVDLGKLADSYTQTLREIRDRGKAQAAATAPSHIEWPAARRDHD